METYRSWIFSCHFAKSSLETLTLCEHWQKSLQYRVIVATHSHAMLEVGAVVALEEEKVDCAVPFYDVQDGT